jgi:hypothetical protein
MLICPAEPDAPRLDPSERAGSVAMPRGVVGPSARGNRPRGAVLPRREPAGCRHRSPTASVTGQDAPAHQPQVTGHVRALSRSSRAWANAVANMARNLWITPAGHRPRRHPGKTGSTVGTPATTDPTASTPGDHRPNRRHSGDHRLNRSDHRLNRRPPQRHPAAAHSNSASPLSSATGSPGGPRTPGPSPPPREPVHRAGGARPGADTAGTAENAAGAQTRSRPAKERGEVVDSFCSCRFRYAVTGRTTRKAS